MAVELHLPDLPDVPIALGAPPTGVRRPRMPWSLRLADVLSSYLPILLMGLLALGTWWLVKNTPPPLVSAAPAAPRAEPDYTMQAFAIERFARDGALKVRVEGAQMRHFPDTDRIEIDDVRIRAQNPAGRVTTAHARRAIANGDLSEVQLVGGAEVVSETPRAETVQIRGEFLHAFLATERLRTHLPVVVTHGASVIRADGLDYDHLARLIELKGRTRAVFTSPGQGTAAAASR